jgi:hypothetical protein
MSLPRNYLDDVEIELAAVRRSFTRERTRRLCWRNSIGLQAPSPASWGGEYAIPTPGSQPIGITHGPDGAVWFAELAANKVGRLDLKTVGKPIAPGVRADGADPASREVLDSQ